MNNFTAALSSVQQSTAAGLASISLTGNSLFWNIGWSGLSSVNAVFFIDSNSNVQIDAGNNSNQDIPYESSMVGTAPLLLGGNQAQQLLMGTWSLQVITDSFPNGEIMGKVVPNMIHKHHHRSPHCRRSNRRKSNIPNGNGNGNNNNSQMNRMMKANQQMRRSRINRMSNGNRRGRSANGCPDCGENHDDDDDDDTSASYDTE